MQKRLQQLSEWMTEQDVDVTFINSKENIFYLTNFHTDPHERLIGLLMFRDAEPFMIVPRMESSQAKNAGWKHEIIGYSDHENPWELIKKAIEKRDVTVVEKVAFEESVLSYGRSQSLLSIFSDAKVVSVEEKLNNMRVIKDEKEIESIRKAAKMADYGIQVGIDALKEGITEMEVLATIEYELKKQGIQEMSFSTMVLFGEKSGEPHGNPGYRKLKEGDFVLFDMGVVVEGYCSDITRTFVYKSISEEQRKIYDIVLKAELASLEACKPGVRIGDLDSIARNIITKAGYGNFFPHRIGHGMGINVHEFPSMSHVNDEKLKEGMVFTIEPGIYLSDIGGVRIEDDVLITKDGYETLTKFQKQLQIIE
ncbi:M24 family metallopeptidase [Bacillus solimangrovi]|uniref:Metallopeptidase n=1 Tax=Bacillus solimangrovi TaxID=1305675 RepID=A0A1E5LIX7_9BACI|nr:Xaa-Pro peptidase family protein [Bacillus solimangrovi]OEH94040.1 metallopeptidase [Bacillus solimangrovi]